MWRLPEATLDGGRTVVPQEGFEPPTLRRSISSRQAGRLAIEGRSCHSIPMSISTHPYTLEVAPCEKPAGHFRWEIRKQGKLFQRSDKPHRSEGEAWKRGNAEVERLLSPALDFR